MNNRLPTTNNSTLSSSSPSLTLPTLYSTLYLALFLMASFPNPYTYRLESEPRRQKLLPFASPQWQTVCLNGSTPSSYLSRALVYVRILVLYSWQYWLTSLVYISLLQTWFAVRLPLWVQNADDISKLTSGNPMVAVLFCSDCVTIGSWMVCKICAGVAAVHQHNDTNRMRIQALVGTDLDL